MKSTWTIGKKLIAAFLGVSLVVLVLGCLGYWGAVTSEESIDSLGRNNLPSVQALLSVDRGTSDFKAAIRSLVIAGLDDEDRQRQYTIIADVRTENDASLKIYEPLATTEEEKVAWREFVPLLQTYRGACDEFLAMCREYDKMGIPNAPGLLSELEQLVGEQHQLHASVLQMLQTKTVMHGGEDAATCGLGKWLATFKPSSDTIKRLMSEASGAHSAMHASIRTIKEAVQRGDIATATAAYEKDFQPAAATLVNKSLAEMETSTRAANELFDKAQALALGRHAQDGLTGSDDRGRGGGVGAGHRDFARHQQHAASHRRGAV